MELILGFIFLGLVIYYFVKRNKRKKLEKQALLHTSQSDKQQKPVIPKLDENVILKNKKKSKKLWIVLSLVIFIAFIFLAANQNSTLPKNNQANKPQNTKNIQASIIKETDTSFPGRKRNQVEIYAPDAITKHERESILKAVVDKYEKQGYNYIQIFLRPTSDPDYTGMFGSFGSVSYSSDGCGVSGKDCGNDKLQIKVSDYILTEADQKYIDSYIKNHKAILYDFNQDPDNWSPEKADKLEKKFNEAIAKDLGIKPEDVPNFMVL